MEGWIKLHRKFLDWEWYSDSGTVHLFMHLLFKANHETKRWQGIVINRGQFVTSYDKLSAELPLSVQQIRTRLSKLKSTGEITIKNNNKYSIITVTCYSDYQTINKPGNKQITSEQQADNKQITTTKELKELKELKEKNICHENDLDEFDEFWNIYPKNRASRKNSLEKYKSTRKKGITHETIINGARQYFQLTKRERTEQKFIAHATTWLSQERWNNDYTETDNQRGLQQEDDSGFNERLQRIDTLAEAFILDRRGSTS